MTALWTWFQRGGPVMWPLLFCSVAALAVAIERLLALRLSAQAPGKLANQIKPSLLNREYDDLQADAMHSGTPLGRLVAALLHERRLGREDLKDLLMEKGREEVRLLQRRLPILATIATITPLMGLLGTVLGMIQVFEDIARDGAQYQTLSDGISEALLTTAAGLLVAIPALVMHRYLVGQVEAIGSYLEQEGLQVIRLLRSASRPDEG